MKTVCILRIRILLISQCRLSILKNDFFYSDLLLLKINMDISLLNIRMLPQQSDRQHMTVFLPTIKEPAAFYLYAQFHCE